MGSPLVVAHTMSLHSYVCRLASQLRRAQALAQLAGVVCMNPGDQVLFAGIDGVAGPGGALWFVDGATDGATWVDGDA